MRSASDGTGYGWLLLAGVVAKVAEFQNVAFKENKVCLNKAILPINDEG